MLMENFTKERLEESNRLKEKACEDCMRELEGILSDKQMQQFREVLSVLGFNDMSALF